MVNLVSRADARPLGTMWGAGERFVTLDAARGLGAFGVVLWHWSHFFYHGTQSGGVRVPQQPLYDVLSWIYDFGWMGVDFFFVLSGFIFYYFYYVPVSTRRIGAWEFGKRRFARLYPLYGLTLALVICLQILYFHLNGATFVYPPGTIVDLFEAITLTSHWWPNQGFFFNGPSWSISVECFLYLLFFLAARFLAARKSAVFLIFAAIGLALNFIHWPIGRGMLSFFSGALTAQAFNGLTCTTWFKLRPGRIAAGTLVIGLALVAVLFALPHALGWLGHLLPRAPSLANSAVRNLVTIMLFPYLVFLLALIERIRPLRSKCLRFLGDCSYSIYLLHFPLQLVTVIIIDWMGLGRGLLLDPGVFMVWCCVLFLIGALSYYGFEKPLQRLIRSVGAPVAIRASSVAS